MNNDIQRRSILGRKDSLDASNQQKLTKAELSRKMANKVRAEVNVVSLLLRASFRSSTYVLTM
uniref:Uncharacterized protein n=1 Tax=Romanomermis culicivorax TaxID=13658 RepID=A0A915J2Q6_ROMCU